MKQSVYADNAATTRVSDSVASAMMPYIQNIFGNPSSIYELGRDTQKVIEDCRSEVADIFGASPREISFTSGGSESNNWAIKGAIATLKKRGKTHIITTNIEHHALLHPCETLEKEGIKVTYLPVDDSGCIKASQVKDAICDETGLVSVMFANNEIGTIQPIKEIGEICKQSKVWFHTDAVQAVGHIPINVNELNIDLMSISGHKIHAPKGVGLLYVRKGVVLKNLIDGGEQEHGKRAGTENIMGIVALTKALSDVTTDIEEKNKKVIAMRDYLIENVLKSIPMARINGSLENRLAGNANFSLFGVEGEALLLKLDEYGIQASSGSACTTGSLDPSHVLLAIGLPHVVAHGSLRISINEQNTMDDINYILESLPKVMEYTRQMSPIWTEKEIANFKEFYPQH